MHRHIRSALSQASSVMALQSSALRSSEGVVSRAFRKASRGEESTGRGEVHYFPIKLTIIMQSSVQNFNIDQARLRQAQIKLNRFVIQSISGACYGLGWGVLACVFFKGKGAVIKYAMGLGVGFNAFSQLKRKN